MKSAQNIVAAVIGNALENYDTALYVYFVIILGPLFFPHENPTTIMLASFGTLAAGFIGRPLGGIIFSHIGDRLGRKKSLSLSIFLVTIPTFIIGILPSYASIGIIAPLILVTCRLIQGICIGGELGGAMTFIMEHANPNRKGFYSSLIAVSSYLGGFIGTIMGAICLQSFMPSWGWRLPFLLGGIFGIGGYFIRHYMTEPKDFKKLQETGNIYKYPLIEVLKNQKLNMLRAFGVAAGVLAPFYIVTTYLTNILKVNFLYSSSEIMQLNVCLVFLWMSLSLIVGLLADQIGI